MEIMLEKLPGGLFKPCLQDDIDKVKGIATGEGLRMQFSKPRNYKFHKKFFAMLDLGFDCFEPVATEYKGVPVEKNRERFRKDVIIQAGFYDLVVNIKGEVRAEAKSISFGNMEEDEFNKVYNAVANVLLQRVLRNYTRDDLDRVVETLIHF